MVQWKVKASMCRQMAQSILGSGQMENLTALEEELSKEVMNTLVCLLIIYIKDMAKKNTKMETATEDPSTKIKGMDKEYLPMQMASATQAIGTRTSNQALDK